MDTRIFLLPAALREFDDAVEYYESHASGLGSRFKDRVADRLQAIAFDPESFPVVQKGEAIIRDALVRDFPYAVYYIAEGCNIIVVTVHHCSRDPNQWQSRT